ncbi:MAG TPA: radical SAM/SPASM domain-containing protein [Bacteroidales bacterium]|nr:radical SAM/SPASM domain-containing protein [Bacteroidales bacterium]
MKYVNALLNGSSYILGLVLKKPLIWGMPPAINFELTNLCNLRCPECPTGSGSMKRLRGFMDPDKFSLMIRELKPNLLNANLYFQGEPMLHPHFFSFLEEVKGINTTISTNGHYINKGNAGMIAGSDLKKIIISLDGISKNTYQRYRVNGDLNTVLDGIFILSEAIIKSGSGLKIEIQVLKNKFNEHEIPELLKVAKRAGATLKIKSMQVYNICKADDWMPEDPDYSRYTRDGNTFRIKSSLPRRCARLWYNPVITWDLKVLPCCFDKDAEYVMGDLNNESFREIWHGRKLAEFRRMVLNGRENIPVCRNCTSGLRSK